MDEIVDICFWLIAGFVVGRFVLTPLVIALIDWLEERGWE